MPDITQILLVMVVTVLATVLTIVGIQIIHILKEFRKTVEKTNKILDDTGTVTESIAKPMSSMSGLIMGIKSGLEIFDVLKRRREGSREERPLIEK